MPDAIVLLKTDHKEVEKLFKQYEKLGDKAYASKRKVVDQIIEALSTHANIEEQHFYPAVRKQNPDIEDTVLEGLEEHHVVKWTLSELTDLDPQHERFHPKVTVLIESVRHHVEEEETEMFPAVREAMGRKALQELGAELVQAKAIAPVEPYPEAPDTPAQQQPAAAAASAAPLREGEGLVDKAKRGLFGRR